MDILKFSDTFGSVLKSAFAELDKDVQVEGGGWRHGAIEWHVTYSSDALLRFIVFNIDRGSFDDVVLRVHAAATDEEGRWAQRELGSTALVGHWVDEQMAPEMIRNTIEQARSLANSITTHDLQRPQVGWADAHK